MLEVFQSYVDLMAERASAAQRMLDLPKVTKFDGPEYETHLEAMRLLEEEGNLATVRLSELDKRSVRMFGREADELYSELDDVHKKRADEYREYHRIR